MKQKMDLEEVNALMHDMHFFVKNKVSWYEFFEYKISQFFYLLPLAVTTGLVLYISSFYILVSFHFSSKRPIFCDFHCRIKSKNNR